MNRVAVTIAIVKQLVTWSGALFDWQVRRCSAARDTLEQHRWRWEARSAAALARIGRSLPGPVRPLWRRVAGAVGAIVPALLAALTAAAPAGCVAASALLLLLVVALLGIIIPLLAALCLVIPCRARAESSVPPDNGWLVTLGGAEPARLTQGNSVEVLPDGAPASRSMLETIAAAGRTIHLLQLDFEPEFIAWFAEAGAADLPDAPHGAERHILLRHALLDAAGRGVRVRILLNDNAFEDSLPKIRAACSGAPQVEVAGLLISPHRRLGMMHAKALIADGVAAFVVGLPFSQGYLDTQQHRVTDPRRGAGAGGHFPPLGDVGNGVGKKPAHTVSVRLGGPAAAGVDGAFIGLWNAATGQAVAPPVAAPGAGSQSIQVALSVPPLGASAFASGETGILESYLRAIHNARRFIYMEAQYFTSPAIAVALGRALGANPGLQLIMLLNENPDMPTYKFWQNGHIARLGAFPGQVGVFTLWRTQPPDRGQSRPRIMQCYVEAKVAVVDDAWATAGSGNLDGPSLGHLFEYLPPPLSCMSTAREWRNVEINAILYDGIAGQPPTGEVSAMRTLLWREHLGAEAPFGDGAGEGWLGLWQRIAGKNIASLNARQAMSGDPAWPSRILPYAPALDTAGQLSQLGVDIGMFDVARAVPQ